ncbi:MAG: hypothetical protein JW882_09930 [Deltaproteobacteria bacterium]|nr:hypothetical protein [Deltaproteobacteria bacterium]
MSLSDWYVGTTKEFSGTITLDGETPDISGDTVTLRLKTNKTDTDANAVVSVEADVVTQGASGIYEMTVTPAKTKNVDPGAYHYDIEWVTAAGAEYILETGRVNLLARVSDAPV